MQIAEADSEMKMSKILIMVYRGNNGEWGM